MAGIAMPSPVKRAGSVSWYYRAVISADVKAILTGRPKEARPGGLGL